MRKEKVEIGSVYTIKVSGKMAKVKILDYSSFGGWYGINLDTNRQIRIKTAGRIRSKVE